MKSVFPALSVAVALLFLGCFTPLSMSAPGSQDLTFGSGGLAVRPYPPFFHSVESLAVQSDGRIVGAGSAGPDVGVVRWLATGAVDTSFGSNGIVTLPGRPREKVRMALAPDGKIVVLTNREIGPTTFETSVWRLLSTGALDPTFASNGRFVFPTPAERRGLARCVMVQADGKILAGGGTDDGPFLLRLTTAGVLDAAFASAGLYQFSTPNQAYRLTALAQQTDGSLVATGWLWTGTAAQQCFLLRLFPNGAPDHSFSLNGYRVLFAEGELNALTIRGDGALIAAGSYRGDAVLSVIRRNGSRDLVFEPTADGKLFHLGGTDSINSVAVQSNGRIVISGTSLVGFDTSAVSFGIRSDGEVDTTFANNGSNYHNFLEEFSVGRQTVVEAVVALPDGRLLVGGVLYGFGGSTAVLQRLDADTTLHPIESWRITHFGTRLNSGPGADAADPDLDGVPNLAEYAFSQDPNNRLSRTIPVPSLQGNVFRLAFPDPDPTGVKRVDFRAEASALMTGNSWIQLPDTGGATDYLFNLPTAGNPRAFVRLLVDLYP